jgi:putative drug exporter of the RND superfamily
MRPDAPAGPLTRLAAAVVRRYRTVLVVAGLLCVLAAAFGGSALDAMSGGGYTPAGSPAATTQQRLADEFRGGAANLVLVATADEPLDGEPPALQDRLARDERVDWVDSYWSTGDPALLSDDKTSALFLVRLAGDETTILASTRALAPTLTTPDVTVAATGDAQITVEVNDQSERDLVSAELIGAPVVALLLLLIFRTPLAALLPLVVGAASVALTTAVLAVLVQVTDVSLFALNVTTALGFRLAVDYSLFVVTRFREELDLGRPLDDAIAASTALAGRTVLFSALTVAVSIAALLVFPLYFLRSMAYAAIPVVLVAAAASVVVLPAMLRLTGRHLHRFDVLSRFVGPPRATSAGWRRLANAVMRRPVLTGLPVVVLLVLLAAPFLNVHFGLTDHRVLPADAPAHRAANLVAERFPDTTRPTLEVLDRGDTAAELSRFDGVAFVVGPSGGYQDGTAVSPGQPTRVAGGTTWLTVTTEHPADDERTERLVADLRATGADVTGGTAFLVDTKDSILSRLPLALGLIVAATLVLLFLFTGSVLIPVKAIVMNTLSLTASFGAAVYIFQEGHLRWLVGDFTVTGGLEMTTLVLMFCVAFGLSMDYEVFLLSRITEQYLATGDNTDAVATGLAKTGRIVSAAAAVVAAVLVVLATSGLTILKMLGVGLAIAVVVDAVLVRGILVPAFMRLLGRANWWAPAGLRAAHRRFGLREPD